MLSVWTVAFPILLVDIANPVLLAAVVVCMSSARPYAKAIAVIAGHTVSYFVFGVFTIFGLSQFIGKWFAPLLDRIMNPEPGDYIIGFLLGLILIWIAWRWRIKPPDHSQKSPRTETGGLTHHFLFGAFINFVGAPFAVPYFAFINQLMRFGEPFVLPNLLLYNLLYSVPFALVPLLVAILGTSVLPMLERVNTYVEALMARLMPLMLAALGIFLVADAALFFVTGTGLI